MLGIGAYFVQQFTHANLNAAYGMALSPDGAQLYATSYTGDGLLVLARDPYQRDLEHAAGVDDQHGLGLDGVFRVVVSADGRFVYTAGGNNGTGGVCVFIRNTVDGTLTYQNLLHRHGPARAGWRERSGPQPRMANACL